MFGGEDHIDREGSIDPIRPNKVEITMRRFHIPPPILLLAGLLMAPACTDSPDPMPDGNGATTEQDTGTDDQGSQDPTDQDGGDSTTDEPTTGVDGSSGGIDLDELYDCEDPNIQILPMAGPGFDPQTGEFIGPPQDSYVAHTTMSVVLTDVPDELIEMSSMVVEQALQTPGFLGVGLASEFECGFYRTIGLWESEQAMFAFVGSGAHAQAMAQASHLAASGKTAHWEIGAEDMPLTWDMAFEILDTVEPSPMYD